MCVCVCDLLCEWLILVGNLKLNSSVKNESSHLSPYLKRWDRIKESSEEAMGSLSC